MKHSKTTKLLAVFTLTATTLCMSGCGLFGEDETPTTQNTDNSSPKYSTDDSYQDQKLLDDNGKEYTLHRNPDGTETARYDDGKEVTFKRDENGNLNVVSGTAGLLAGLAAGYFLFHGFNTPVGSWNSSANRYAVSEPLKPATTASRANAMKKFTPAGTKIQDIAPPQEKKDDRGGSSTARSSSRSGGSSSGSSNVSNSSSSSKSSSSKSSVGSTKSGFGSAGARSASS